MFTPDGKKIVFRSSGWFGHYSPIAAPRPHAWDYFIADSEGTNVQQLTHNRFYDVSPPSVSPDGKIILVMTEDSHVGQYFATYSLEDGKLLSSFRPHLPHEDKDGPILDNPAFLPDGKKFLFMAADQSKFEYSYEVFLSDVGSSLAIQLTSRNGYAQSLTVSGDGKRAAYVKTRFSLLGKPKETKIYLLDVQSRTATPLETSMLP
jgi:Tol biopolymer transport system component